LKAGSRKISGPVCSPADGRLAQSGPAANNQALQVKGQTYDLNELVYGDIQGLKSLSETDRRQWAWFATVYLAPHNYHRVHAPIGGRLLSIRYIPGKLWPVNQTFVGLVPRLFTQNERLVFSFESENGGRVSVVMVGALNVGRMTTRLWPELTTNGFARQCGSLRIQDFKPPQETRVSVGDELGIFMLGSTVVMAFDQEAARAHRFVQSSANEPILMGQSLLN
jgi:phosphatidylserine decarboxylase